MYTEKMKGLQNKSKIKSDKLYDQICELAQRPGKQEISRNKIHEACEKSKSKSV